MVAAETEQVEVNSPATTNTRTNNVPANGNAANGVGGVNFPIPSLGRQSSIYSLTLDEFQNTLCEGGKSFGSMNMDEFLHNIWTAEENNQNYPSHPPNDAVLALSNPTLPVSAGRGAGIARQPSLSRQGSLSVPAPLCCKTVEEVWSEIQRGGGGGGGGGAVVERPQQRQHTFGEMTLEDFLVKAGVVPPPPPTMQTPPMGRHQQQVAPPEAATPFEMYPNGMAHTFGPTPVPVMTVPGGYPALPQNGGGGDYGTKRNNNGYVAVPPGGVCYGNGGGYGAGLGMASPVSPLGSEGMDVGALRVRKRTLDGPVEKVVERRQRRMIKNRESAARSRARKQAYTVELEAELNLLREENTQLKQAQAELEKQRNQEVRLSILQQCVEEKQEMPQSRADKAQDRPELIRRIKSCQW